MWGELLGLLAVYVVLVTGAVGMLLRDGQRFDDHVADALEVAQDLDQLPLDERIRNGL
jgi:hypothetical protein